MYPCITGASPQSSLWWLLSSWTGCPGVPRAVSGNNWEVGGGGSEESRECRSRGPNAPLGPSAALGFRSLGGQGPRLLGTEVVAGQILIVPLTSSGSLGEFLNISEPQLLSPSSGGSCKHHLTQCVWKSLAQSRYSVDTSSVLSSSLPY